jgi:hypothetical protein
MELSPKENLLRVIQHRDPQWVPNGMESVIMLMPPVIERPRQAGYDSWGVLYEFSEETEGGSYPAQGGHTITDLAQWRRQITIPDVQALDWEDIRLDWQAKERVRPEEIDRSEHLVCGIVEFGLFERSYMLLGMENALVAYLTMPELMDELLAAIADYKIALIARFHEAVPLDIVWYGDDWGTQLSTFLRPELWRRLIKPHTQRVYDAMRERGIIINQHSCGKIEPLLGDMVEMGASIWNPCQPCNDLAALKKRHAGRIAFCGGIDSQFVLGRPGVTPEETRAEVRRRIDEMGAGGGYIAGQQKILPPINTDGRG